MYCRKQINMKKIILILTLSVFVADASGQQKLFSKNTIVSFFSATALENIDAKNEKGLVVWDKISGNIEFSVLMKGFIFKKALMQEHFNENYVESDKYPKAVFKGVIEKNNIIDLTKNNTVSTFATGMLTLHGVTKPAKAITVIAVKDGKISATSTFTLLLSDYNIKVPGIMKNKISNSIEIKVSVATFTNL